MRVKTNDEYFRLTKKRIVGKIIDINHVMITRATLDWSKNEKISATFVTLDNREEFNSYWLEEIR